MNMQTPPVNTGYRPTFEEERAEMADIFSELANGHSPRLRALTLEFFKNRITQSAIEHAIPYNLSGLMLDRLQTGVQLTGLYAAVENLLQSEACYVHDSGAIAAAPALHTQLVDEFTRMAKGFENHAVFENNKGRKFMRDMRELGAPADEFESRFFSARLGHPSPGSPGELHDLLKSHETALLKTQRQARAQDLAIAQFRMIELYAGAVLHQSHAYMQTETSKVKSDYARALFNDSDPAAAAPGNTSLANAIEYTGHILPVFTQNIAVLRR